MQPRQVHLRHHHSHRHQALKECLIQSASGMAKTLAELNYTGPYHLWRVNSGILSAAADRKGLASFLSSVSTFKPDLEDSFALLVRGHSRLTDPAISYR